MEKEYPFNLGFPKNEMAQMKKKPIHKKLASAIPEKTLVAIAATSKMMEIMERVFVILGFKMRIFWVTSIKIILKAD